MKNRQALHEIIRALSLSIIFVEFSFKPVHPTMVVKSFKFMTGDIYTHIQVSFVVILRWYSKKRDARSSPRNIAVKDLTILTRHSQIWHKACS